MADRILNLQHKGGEYLSINISGVTEDRTDIWQTIERAEELLLRPSTTQNVALQILDSRLSRAEMERLAGWLLAMKDNISRLAIIGVKTRNKIAFNRLFRRSKLPIAVEYIYN